MKNKLHTISVHPERSEGSHNTTNHVTSSSEAYREVKFSNFQILLFSILCSLFSSQATAQPYQWTWATYGSSDAGFDGWDFRSEQVYDVVVGNDNNYYFLANIRRSSIGSSGSQLAGQLVTVYSKPQGGNNMILPDLTI